MQYSLVLLKCLQYSPSMPMFCIHKAAHISQLSYAFALCHNEMLLFISTFAFFCYLFQAITIFAILRSTKICWLLPLYLLSLYILPSLTQDSTCPVQVGSISPNTFLNTKLNYLWCTISDNSHIRYFIPTPPLQNPHWYLLACIISIPFSTINFVLFGFTFMSLNCTFSLSICQAYLESMILFLQLI